MLSYGKQPDGKDTDNVNDYNTGINGTCHHISLNFLMKKEIIYALFKHL
jgi:hypothetical protein